MVVFIRINILLQFLIPGVSAASDKNIDPVLTLNYLDIRLHLMWKSFSCNSFPRLDKPQWNLSYATGFCSVNWTKTKLAASSTFHANSRGNIKKRCQNEETRKLLRKASKKTGLFSCLSDKFVSLLRVSLRSLCLFPFCAAHFDSACLLWQNFSKLRLHWDWCADVHFP
jgi:hypothetical protein